MSKERALLRNEAVKINGTYVEDQIQGYQTLSATGRKTLPKELSSVSSLGDGSTLNGSRFPARTIKVNFLIEDRDVCAMDGKLLKLNEILSKNNSQIIFNDEPDMYLTGTPIMPDSVDKGVGWVSGTYEIQCLDPFKYKTTETVLDNTSLSWDSVNKQWTFTCNGTYKAYPRMTVSFPRTDDASGDNTDTSAYSFVGFVNQAEKILQFGSDTDTEPSEVAYESLTLINHKFSAWGSFSHETGLALADGHAYPSSYGSGTGWHGPAMSCTLSDTAGATNFSATMKHKFVGNKKEFGGIRFQVIDTSVSPNEVLAEAIIRKSTKDDKCVITMKIGSKSVKFSNIKVSKIGTTQINKEGSKITIKCGSKTKSIKLSSMENKKAYKVNVKFEQNGSKTALGTNYVTSIRFDKNNGTYIKDATNTFAPGDELDINCADASVELNGISALNIGALGNDWEDFTINPGQNIVKVDYVGWKTNGTVTPPVFALSYRERFL